MSINSLGQYSANHKVWDHVGNIIPDVEHSEGERPAIEFKPAAWLPVVYKDKYFEDWNVIMPAKIVALDNDGRVVPAQYGLAAATYTYTQNDVDAGVVDVKTGLPLLVGAIGTANVADIDTFMGRAAEEAAISKPIGVAPYAYLRWAGGDGSNPAQFIENNYQRQHQVAVLCDYVINVPLIPATQTATSLAFGSPSAGISTSSAVGNLPVATNTPRTPIVFSSTDAGKFTNQVSSLAQVLSTGDWFINQLTGVVSVFASAAPTVNISYYHYAAAASTFSVFASATGNLHAGDFVKCDANSNFVLAASNVNFQDVIGQILERDANFPKDALDRVRTAFNPSINTLGTGALPGSLGQLDQMPGSATGGMPASITYAGASDTLVRINLCSR
jgi:hypothetical protein